MKKIVLNLLLLTVLGVQAVFAQNTFLPTTASASMGMVLPQNIVANGVQRQAFSNVLSAKRMALSDSSRPSDNKLSLCVYGGLSYNGVTNKNFEDFHISDWQDFGLGGYEGRVAVPLSKRKRNSAIALYIGGELGFTKKDAIILEANIGGNMGYGAIGYTRYFKTTDKLKIGGNIKFGYARFSVNFGNIELIQSYVPPVIIPEGTFNAGDAINVKSRSYFTQLALTGEYKINDKISFKGNLGFSIGSGRDTNIEVTTKDLSVINIPINSKSIVKANATAQQYGTEPRMSLSGVVLQIGVAYNISNLVKNLKLPKIL